MKYILFNKYIIDVFSNLVSKMEEQQLPEILNSVSSFEEEQTNNLLEYIDGKSTLNGFKSQVESIVNQTVDAMLIECFNIPNMTNTMKDNIFSQIEDVRKTLLSIYILSYVEQKEEVLNILRNITSPLNMWLQLSVRTVDETESHYRSMIEDGSFERFVLDNLKQNVSSTETSPSMSKNDVVDQFYEYLSYKDDMENIADELVLLETEFENGEDYDTARVLDIINTTLERLN